MKPLIISMLSLALCLLLATEKLPAQDILIDKGVLVEDLWCFPLLTDTLTYLYLPPRARLAFDEDSLPKFSFMRYILEKPSEGNEGQTITQADGGGILHFLVLYDTPPKQVARAEKVLQQKFQNDKISIRGPKVFDEGRYALVSSILNPSTGEKEHDVIGMGDAPVLENNRIAFSFEVDPTRSKILLENFKMATPDISLVFDLTFSGLSGDYQAELEIDWSEVKKHQSFGAGGSIYFIGADVEVGFDEMRRDNAIKLTVMGDDDNMDALLNTVYDKLLQLMFEPAKPERVEQAGGLGDAFDALLGSSGMMGSRNTTGFGLNVSYKLKELKSTGKGYLRFNGRSRVQRHHFVTFNIGRLYHQYGQNPEIFRDVPLWDPTFQQREVFIGVDGTLEREFDRMINSVTVKVRKQHANGVETVKEILVDKNIFSKLEEKPVSIVYLNQGDADRTAWLNYQYQTTWQFIGEGGYTTEWQEENASMINLFAPFRRRRIDLEGDLALLESQGVRAVSVKISYPFFGREKTDRLTIRPGDDLSAKSFEITLPNEEEFVDYTITWMKSDGSRPTVEGKDPYGLIFIDELPAE